jgi:hypothetical protein
MVSPTKEPPSFWEQHLADWKLPTTTSKEAYAIIQSIKREQRLDPTEHVSLSFKRKRSADGESVYGERIAKSARTGKGVSFSV